jgi:hypothetical protein
MKSPQCIACFCLVLAHAGAWGLECEIKGFEFLAAAKDNMWPAPEAKRVDGQGDCSVVGNSVVSAGAIDGEGVTCEAMFFGSTKLKSPWKVQQIKFSGASATFTTPPAFPASSAQIVVKTKAGPLASTSLNVTGVVLVTTEANCQNWRDALKGQAQ